jgi:hypothetical protein
MFKALICDLFAPQAQTRVNTVTLAALRDRLLSGELRVPADSGSMEARA